MLERVALFPGYLFIDTDSDRIEQLATNFRNISGFNIVLSTDGDYLPLTDAESAFAEMIYEANGTFDF